MTVGLTMSEEDFWTEAAQLSYCLLLRLLICHRWGKFWQFLIIFDLWTGKFSTAWKTWGSSKVWTDELLGVPSTLQITVDKTQETWHSASPQALPWFQRYSQPHLNPSHLLTKLTSNFSIVGGNYIWGVNNAPMQVQVVFLSGMKYQTMVREGCCSYTGLCCSSFFKGMADIRVKKRNTQKKLLNPS